MLRHYLLVSYSYYITLPVPLAIRRSIVETLCNISEIYLFEVRLDDAIRLLKKNITRLERLRGSRVVVAEEKVITVYRANRDTEKKVLRQERRRRRRRAKRVQH